MPSRVKKGTLAPYKSLFEVSIADQLRAYKCKAKYESNEIPYLIVSTYTPDFRIPNGVFIEAKGYFDNESRRKMKAVKKYNPELDIRIVFQKAHKKLSNKAKMTYAEWADKNGFPWAEGSVPEEWVRGPYKEVRIKKKSDLVSDND